MAVANDHPVPPSMCLYTSSEVNSSTPNQNFSKFPIEDLEECLTNAAFGRKGKRDLTIITLQDFKKFIHEP